MNIIILSGGSGKRLWPLSNDIRSKQFMKIYRYEDGSYESMVQRVYRQIKSIDNKAVITIATSKSQVSALRNQLGDQVNLSVEPARCDTFPAIALAVSYMHDILGIEEDDSVSVCPVDHYVDTRYYEVAERIGEEAKKGEAELVLMGIKPTFPSDKYGYIIPQNNSDIAWVKMFKEKPDVERAKQYISDGALWNAGVFAFKLKYVLDIAKKILGTNKYDELLSSYTKLEKNSFDYAVVEKAKRVKVLRYDGVWRDMGSWSMLTETMAEITIGNVILDEDCINTHIINNLDIPIVCAGLNNITVAASPDGILVADRLKADGIKKHVEKINQDVMYAEKSWGDFHVIDVTSDSMTIKVTMKANDHMSYHSHEHRKEIWTIVSGFGETVIDGIREKVRPGDVIRINEGVRHTIYSMTDLVIIEVQVGKDISVNDKKKYTEDIYRD